MSVAKVFTHSNLHCKCLNNEFTIDQNSIIIIKSDLSLFIFVTWMKIICLYFKTDLNISAGKFQWSVKNRWTSATPCGFILFLFVLDLSSPLTCCSLSPQTHTSKPTGAWDPAFFNGTEGIWHIPHWHIVLLTSSPELKDTFQHRHRLKEEVVRD